MRQPFMRPVRESDFPAIHALAKQSGGGMTNLPMDEATLHAKIGTAVACFAGGATKPGGEFYMLVLDQDGVAMGTGAVFASIGRETGFVNYKINREFYFSISLRKRFSRDVLIPTHDFTDCAEVGSLFLSPKAQGSGLGRMIARSRYLFIAQSPEVIADPICAELRGWRAPNGDQPFWNAVGGRFFDMKFEEADAYNAAFGNQFIEDLMPRYPIYVDMLPEDARACIGKPHDDARPAYKMLMEEGFIYDEYIDVFDGGPLVEARVGDLRTVRESRVVTVAAVADVVQGEDALMATGAVASFRATRSRAALDGDTVTIDRATAAALQAEPGSVMRWARW